MTRPEDIPEDVWRHAQSVAAAYSNAVNDVWILNSCVRRLRARAEIARALIAAEQRGAERAADEAEGMADAYDAECVLTASDANVGKFREAEKALRNLATAIRKGGGE